MESFIRVSGPAAALPAANIDTDVIMPKQFLKRIDRAGLSEGLFHDLRFDAKGQTREDFILNRPETRSATFLIVGSNFGCGSSREHAVWGLMQYGIRALIGTDYAGIFFDNCARNGLPALSLSEAEIISLVRATETQPGVRLTVDLQAQRIETPVATIAFDIDAALRKQLMEGLDAIDQTLGYKDDIVTFEDCHFAANPWLGARR
ncbi:3-isopropylmalate dehydratase small subunit [Puniceibacterium sp. IMCC21224]|uniref:3-isopropylmalate dehydratase small subunit n=1 Tax=Puniceibacterium sp. IMCC21224 TaxID=1618204 RepID=UPI00064E1251|nr:3-isopropylmalate dehydratase small subunit [Puniceibacterium sp. IMCC21224]KMK69087.1 3-isopropylmalate dehydratase, small subunit [Puniceibacterium sp. IMCC21224]